MFHRIIFSLLSLVLFASCGVDFCPPSSERIGGECAMERYYDSQGYFSICASPIITSRHKKEFLADENYSGVMMSDEMGNLLKIETVELPDDIYLIMAEAFKDPHEQLKHLFVEAVLPEVDRFCKYRVIEQEKFDLEEIGPAYYVALEVYEGSTLVEINTNKRQDTVRSYLITFSGSQVIFLCTQLDGMFAGIWNRLTSGKDKAPSHLKKDLIEVRKTYINERER